MAKVGYIFKENNDSFDAEREWMQRYGCVQIVEETVEHETLRPMWKQLMANLQRGDEIVISKFTYFIKFYNRIEYFNKCIK